MERSWSETLPDFIKEHEGGCSFNNKVTNLCGQILRVDSCKDLDFHSEIGIF